MYEARYHGRYKFVFKYDDDAPELLHIYARHLKSPEQAIEVWFKGGPNDVWNAEYNRFETTWAISGFSGIG